MKPSLWLSQEQEVFIQGPCGKIQAGLSEYSDTKTGVLVCHPHPLHQGTMFNKVVTTIVQAGRHNQLCTVRFNYRGVGESQGEFDHAVGEVDDALSVGRWMIESLGCERIILIGFSFGACIAFNIQNALPGKQCIMLCPSVDRMHFNSGGRREVTVIQAQEDEVVDAASVQAWVQDQKNIQFKWMPGSSHFFHGQLIPLKSMLIELISG